MSHGSPKITAMGHHFGPDLVCSKRDCNVTWQEHQLKPTECHGYDPSARNVRLIAKLCLNHKISYAMIGERAGGLSKERVRQVLQTRSDMTTETYAAVVKACEELLAQQGVVRLGDAA